VYFDQLWLKFTSPNNGLFKVLAWTTLGEDYIAFFLSAPKCTNYTKQSLMLELSKTDTKSGFSTGPQVRM
jgi:hypothetical protein